MENKTVEMVVKDLLLADNRKKGCGLSVRKTGMMGLPSGDKVCWYVQHDDTFSCFETAHS